MKRRRRRRAPSPLAVLRVLFWLLALPFRLVAWCWRNRPRRDPPKPLTETDLLRILRLEPLPASAVLKPGMRYHELQEIRSDYREQVWPTVKDRRWRRHRGLGRSSLPA